MGMLADHISNLDDISVTEESFFIFQLFSSSSA